uniref:Sleeping Beauty transposase HTH domain-containing protein n=1 Tax=Oncorhynchus tshawytscha TaxID=74940 RepID=A0AAZ3PNI7_ONCTS
MKNKEHTRQVRDTVVKKFKAGFGYKKISQALNIPRSTVQAIILKWKEYQTTANLPRPGRHSKLSAHTRRRLIRDAAKRPMITLDELQRSTAEVGDSRISVVYCTNLAFMEEWQEESHFLKISIKSVV